MLNPVVSAGELTETDRFIFESWGYFVIPDVLSAEEVKQCLEASERVHKAAGTEGFGQVGRGYETEPALEQLMDHPAVLPKIRGLYGDRFIMQSGWNTKQPAFGGMGGWHQDGSGAYDFKKLSFPQIPLVQLRASFLLTDQTQPRMGNMELIPGSHRSQVAMPEALRKEKGDVSIGHVICAPAGSVLVFHNAVWHRTYAHDGDYDRYTMHYIYSPPWVRASDRLQNSKAFLEQTTPLRRALMGEFHRPDAPFGSGYEVPPFEG
ncbi:phytanoyl-CoA dioxygenase family protein [Paenibacillus sp. BC26]|uniref:phytanoyl-CoA dioxygenase family protein n=1 Tax=Paenibacillus sp. BC26 TaxID=1881032 RepID=UPI0008F3C170|nr:phytanoyl-CoA dioxygenase family protein [Paenibacillus sp. BC26]SFS99874.1 Phytanoyl-CoA dioxygenase (PhyH) [Paenibacillus sp. BC26]